MHEYTQRSRKLIYDLPSLDEAGGVLLAPPFLPLDLASIEQLRDALALVTDDDDTNTTAVQVTSGHGTTSTETTRTEVDGVRCSLGEVASFGPVNGLGEDELAEELRKGTLGLGHIGAWGEL